jgi:hypothetical protein
LQAGLSDNAIALDGIFQQIEAFSIQKSEAFTDSRTPKGGRR